MKHIMTSLFLGVMFISGCSGKTMNPTIVVDHPTVFMPDSKLFQCPVVSGYPDSAVLTDNQVAELLVTLDTNNRVCKNSIDAVRSQLLTAQRRLETKP